MPAQRDRGGGRILRGRRFAVKHATKKNWEGLPPWLRTALALGGVADAALRVYALVDVARRPEDEINGSKTVWVPALAVVSSMGLLPCAYLCWGRRTS